MESGVKNTFPIKTVLFTILIFLFAFISCKNNSESKLVYTENNTIKQNVKEKEEEVTWTNEIEGERLTQRINRGSIEIGSEVPYNKEIYKLFKVSPVPVYPSYSDFGSLDTSNLKISTKDKLNSFCTALSSGNNNADAFFNKKYVFNYVFLMDDLGRGWEKHFNTKLPEDKKLFSKWLFGEPFYGADIIQIPVRFYADYGIIDMTVFLSASGNNEIYQIIINKWEKV